MGAVQLLFRRRFRAAHRHRREQQGPRHLRPLPRQRPGPRLHHRRSLGHHQRQQDSATSACSAICSPIDYRVDPQPDNVLNLTQWDKDFTLELTYRKQVNNFNDVTERLPELALDVTRHAVTAGSNLFYDGQTSAGRYQLSFAQGGAFQNYTTTGSILTTS